MNAPTPAPFWHRRPVRAAVAAWLALLSACGGGDWLVAIPGVGTGGTGIVAGIVSGLGSVIVDGVRYDDSNATLLQQPDLVSTETLTPSAFQVGQYVEIELDANGTAQKVLLHPQLVGTVTAVRPNEQALRVWGQTVRTNADPAQGPVTVFAGVESLADLQPNDVVQVHGSWVAPTGDGTVEHVHATRIERLATAPSVARVSGALRTGGRTGWQLAGMPLDLSRTRWLPPGSGPQAGQVVTAVGPWLDATDLATQAWAPSGARTWQPSLAATAGTQRLSGRVRLLGAGLIDLQGTTVDVSAPALAGVLQALKPEGYATVAGTWDATNGRLVAASVELPPGSGRPVELHGTVESWSHPGAFTVRGMRIDASAARFSGLPASALGPGSYVELTGRVSGNTVRATEVSQPTALPDKAVLQLTGTVKRLDNQNGRMDIVTGTGQTLTTQLPVGMALPKEGETVRVEGYWRNGQLQSPTWNPRPPPER